MSESKISKDYLISAVEDIDAFVSSLPADHPTRGEWSRARNWIHFAIDNEHPTAADALEDRR